MAEKSKWNWMIATERIYAFFKNNYWRTFTIDQREGASTRCNVILFALKAAEWAVAGESAMRSKSVMPRIR